jgi:hypothetical protein
MGNIKWQTLPRTQPTFRFRFPELDNTKTHTWPFHVDNKTKPTEASDPQKRTRQQMGSNNVHSAQKRLLMYECSQFSSGSTKRTTKRTSVSQSHCQKYQQKNSKNVDMLQQSTRVWKNTTSPWTKHRNICAQQSSPGATTHGSRRDTRHLPVQKDGQKWET